MNLTQRLLLALLVLVALTTAAWAENKSGMYWMSESTADGVTVRRLEDSTHGVVCYTASKYVSSTGVGVGISCLKVTP